MEKDLVELLEGIPVETRGDYRRVKVKGLEYDSRKVKEGELFFCVRGFQDDGHRYLYDAERNGAVAGVVEYFVDGVGIPQLKVNDVRLVMSEVSARFYSHPSNRIKVIGITGTKGKTTTTFLVDSILRASGYSSGLLGTVAYRLGNKVVKAHRTTPEAVDLQRMLYEAADTGLDAVVMEVSSHSLSLHRVSHVRFVASLLTNLQPEHLDFHGSMEGYMSAKAKLFELTDGVVVLNRDTKHFDEIASCVKDRELYTYSLRGMGDVNASVVQMDENGISLRISHAGNSFEVESPLVGMFNVYNVTAAIALALFMGVPIDDVVKGVSSLSAVPGRMERIDTPWGWRVVVDYAHTVDSYRELISAVRSFTKGRIISVFGLGGNRDPRHRPAMGKLSVKVADFVVITSDNPRWEEPSQIAKAIEQGCIEAGGKGKYEVILDRKEAIRYAMRMARPGDTVVVSGKGHEDYILIKGKYYPYSDRDVVNGVLREMVG